MPLTLSHTSTDWRAMLSDGALQTNSGMHLNLPSYSHDNLNYLANSLNQIVHFPIKDGTGGSLAYWSTSNSIGNSPIDAKYRLIACYVLSHLSGESLAKVCENMFESYAWNLENSNLKTLSEKTRHRVKASGTRIVERPSMSFDQE